MIIDRKPIDATFDAIENNTLSREQKAEAEEVGEILSAANGIVRVSGLAGAGYQELVRVSDKSGNFHPGMVIDLAEDRLSVAMLDNVPGIGAGLLVRRTGKVIEAPVGDALLGRVVDALGRQLDDKDPLHVSEYLPIERSSPPIMDRQAVRAPLQTGILAVDALVPIGRGQRELIIGDRQTGKSAIAIDAIINQAGKNCIAVYCCIGLPLSMVSGIVEDLRKGGAMDYTVVVVSSGEDTPGLNYITPFAATTIGEYFMAQKKDVLVIYDDLTRHARSYRELSLLLRRPPAREAFPGDIFYLHSRLLERATHLTDELGGGSLTALPIAETEAQNISAYIPTNLISITDGQIYLSSKSFVSGQLPAIDVMRSVSRVGGEAQLPAFRALSGALRLSYAQFEELEAFSRFDTALDEATLATLERGKRIRALLRQPQLTPLPVYAQIVLLIALNAGIFDTVPLESMNEIKSNVVQATISAWPELGSRLETGGSLSDEDNEKIAHLARETVKQEIDRVKT